MLLSERRDGQRDRTLQRNKRRTLLIKIKRGNRKCNYRPKHERESIALQAGQDVPVYSLTEQHLSDDCSSAHDAKGAQQALDCLFLVEVFQVRFEVFNSNF